MFPETFQGLSVLLPVARDIQGLSVKLPVSRDFEGLSNKVDMFFTGLQNSKQIKNCVNERQIDNNNNNNTNNNERYLLIDC